MGNFLRSWVFLGVLLVAVWPVVAASPEARVQFREGHLSVVFANVPIRVALEEIAARTGITVLLDPEIKGTISTRFQDLPLEVGLRRLLRNQSHAFVFSDTSRNGHTLASVKVFREGQQSSTKYEVLSGKEAAIVPVTTGGQTGGVGNETSGGGGAAVGSGTPGVAGPGGGEQNGTETTPGGSPGAAINPHGVAAPAQVMAAIAETQRNMDYLQRKSDGEERALRRNMAEVQQQLASDGSTPQADPREVLDKLRAYEDQLARSKQSNALRMLEEQKKMQALTETLANVSTPAERARSQALRQQQQLEVQKSQAAAKALAERRAGQM